LAQASSREGPETQGWMTEKVQESQAKAKAGAIGIMNACHGRHRYRRQSAKDRQESIMPLNAQHVRALSVTMRK